MHRLTTKKITLLIAGLLLCVSALLPQVARAATYERYDEGFVIVPEECINPDNNLNADGSDKQCDLNSFVQLFVNLAQVALKILPYIAMIMMIWAGFDLITSGGNPEKIQSGKKFISSIVVGIIIVTIMAWSLSYFIVFILTGDGHVFPNYAWEKEWWGGGGVAERPPSVGCCVVTDTTGAGVGCVENLKDGCAAIQTAGAAMNPPIPISAYFQGENQYCSEVTQCKNYQEGCCVPRDTSDETCYYPEKGSYSNDEGTGCLSWLQTVNNPNNCDTLGQCKTIGNKPAE